MSLVTQKEGDFRRRNCKDRRQTFLFWRNIVCLRGLIDLPERNLQVLATQTLHTLSLMTKEI